MNLLLNNWNLYPKNICDLHVFSTYQDISNFIKVNNNIIARGNGRCYGDASLSQNVISTKKLNNIISFDKKEGIITCQSGVLIENILSNIIPHGFFIPVTPGTKFITIGGALASDIHGKNHHKVGVFSDHVLSFDLINTSGDIIKVYPNDDLFFQTAGGMGSTGIIIEITFKLIPIETSFIKQTSFCAKNLKEIFNLFESHSNSTYSVAWIDCLAKGENIGKSVLLLGEHASVSDINKGNKLIIDTKSKFKIPFYFPSWVLNPFLLKIFNFIFYSTKYSRKTKIVDYDSFFYPLDKIHNWNKMYGKKGFIQYQFVIPKLNSYDGLKEILEILSKYQLGSFLAVLKLFGKSHENRYLHFPIEGYTLAVDIKITQNIWTILNLLDDIVNKYNGKVYLTKDARMSKLSYELQYTKINALDTKFYSHQMSRLSRTHTHYFLIIGANSDIAKATAIKYLSKYKNGHLILASRNITDLNNFININNYHDRATVIFYDISPSTNINKFIDILPAKPNWIMYAAGYLFENDNNDHTHIHNTIYVNYLGAVLLLNALIIDHNPYLQRIIGISSIAGLRGRKSNYIYGSSKSGFHQYLFGLRQDLKSRKITVQAITPGIVNTKMTNNIQKNKFTNSTSEIANSIFNNRKSFEIYPSLYWKFVSIIVKYSPEYFISKL
jgi:decaprenylphospho-beta-D-ribofuranose 2-oxidase